MRFGKVYLRGAYGPGNLGDDVLMICMIKILNEYFDEKDILVGVEDVIAAKKNYKGAVFVNYKEPAIADYFIYGGGGQFFTFNIDGKSADIVDNGLFFKALSFFRKNKSPVNMVTRLIFSLMGAAENLVLSKKIASYSIGLGPFENEGKGLVRYKNFLEKADFVSVRDQVSLSHVHRYGKNANLFVDPTFNKNDWFYENKNVPTTTIKAITYIVRAWPFSDEGRVIVENMIAHAKSMQACGHLVKLVSLYPKYDEDLIKSYPEFDWLLYDYREESAADFVSRLINSASYILSARAHGVWLPVICGVPVLAVEVEPKLMNVHRSLPCSTFITSGKSLQDIESSFKDFVENYDALKQHCVTDVESNRVKAENAKEVFINWLRGV